MNNQLTASEDAKKKRYKKLIAVCGLLLIGVIAILAVRHAVERYEEEQYLASYGQSALSIGGYTANYDLYRYFYLNYRDELEYRFTDDAGNLDTSGLDRAVRERVSEAVRGLYGTVSLADDYGFTVSDGDVRKVADTYIDAVKAHYKENGGSYEKDLAANYMTNEVFTFLMCVDALEDKLFDTLVSDGGEIEDNDEKVLAILSGEDFVRAKLIFIENDEGEDPENNRKLAEEALAAYKDGTDFDTLIGRYSEDYSMPIGGYYFTRMEMLEEIETAAFSIQDGEISPVVPGADGYYLVLRLPKEAAYITEHFADLKAQYQSAVFYGKIDDRAALLTVHETEYVRALSYEEIR